MLTIYKILTYIVAAVAAMLALSLLVSIPLLFSSALTMLSGFMMVSIILYAWFVFKFLRDVVQQQNPVKLKLKDWIKVNGIVCLVFSAIIFLDVVVLLQRPELYAEILKSSTLDIPMQSITSAFYVMLVYSVILFIHVLWTFSLMRKHKAYFVA